MTIEHNHRKYELMFCNLSSSLASIRALNRRPGPDQRINLRGRQSVFLEHFTGVLSE